MKLKSFGTIVFVTGLSITAIEVSAARVVAPFFGSTIYVWGSAIGVVLIGLAAGYILGGKIIDRFTTLHSVGVALFIAGMSGIAVGWFYQEIGARLQQWTTQQHIPIAIGSLCLMLVLFIIPITAMGMVSPMILRLAVSDVQTAGSISGLLSGLSTIGSIIGTFVSAFWSIPFIGTRATILIASVVLLGLGLIVGLPKKIPTQRILPVVILLVLFSAWLVRTTPMLARAGLLWEKDSAYQLVQVLEKDKTRYLVHDAGFGTQSTYTPGNNFTGSPYDVFGVTPYLIQPPRERVSILLLGLGGGSMPRLLQHVVHQHIPLHITAVEIDPAVITAAKRYFDLDSSSITIVTADARQFLRTTNTQFDIIIVDAYTHEMQIPPMLATQEFFTEIYERLEPGGVMAMNALAFPESTYLPKLLRTIATVFPDTREAPFTVGSLNHIILAGANIPNQRDPRSMDPVLEQLYTQLWPRLRNIHDQGPVFRDDRTDLEVLVRPFIR